MTNMKTFLKRMGFGVVLWAVLYAASMPLLPLMATDIAAFKAIMAALGVLVGGAFAAYYFLGVQGGYLREGLWTAVTWMVTNWILDIAALLPFTHQTVPQYFAEIGVEYIGMLGVLLAIGYVLDKKTDRRVPNPTIVTFPDRRA